MNFLTFSSEGDLGGEILVRARDHVNSFAVAMARVYKSKDRRRDAGLRALNNIFWGILGYRTLRLRAGLVGSLECDGFDTGGKNEPICVVEFKNEQESSCIPIALLPRACQAGVG